MVTPAARREAVAHLRVTYEVSERRACSALGADRYRSRRAEDAAARARLRELASVRRRFGYRRLNVLLEREGEERLQVRRRRGRKRALGTREPMVLPQDPNQRWSLDFLSDATTDGRRFRILAIIDDFTRESLALITDTGPLAACARSPSRRGVIRSFTSRRRYCRARSRSIRCRRSSTSPKIDDSSFAFCVVFSRSGHLKM